MNATQLALTMPTEHRQTFRTGGGANVTATQPPLPAATHPEDRPGDDCYSALGECRHTRRGES